MTKYLVLRTCALKTRVKAGGVMTEAQIKALNGGVLPDKDFLAANFKALGVNEKPETEAGDYGFKTNDERKEWLIAKGVPFPAGAGKLVLERLIRNHMEAAPGGNPLE